MEHDATDVDDLNKRLGDLVQMRSDISPSPRDKQQTKNSASNQCREPPPRMPAHLKPRRVSAPLETPTRYLQSSPRPQDRLETSNHPRRHSSGEVTDARDRTKAVGQTSQHASYARSQDRVVDEVKDEKDLMRDTLIAVEDSANSEGMNTVQIEKHFSSSLRSPTVNTETRHVGEYSGLLQDDSNYSDLLDGLSSVAAEDEIDRADFNDQTLHSLGFDVIGSVPTKPSGTTNGYVGDVGAFTDIGNTSILEVGGKEVAPIPIIEMSDNQIAQTPILEIDNKQDAPMPIGEEGDKQDAPTPIINVGDNQTALTRHTEQTNSGDQLHVGEYSGLLQDDSNYSDLLDGLSSVAAEDEIDRADFNDQTLHYLGFDVIGSVPRKPNGTTNGFVGDVGAFTDIGNTPILEVGGKEVAPIPIIEVSDNQIAQTPILEIDNKQDAPMPIVEEGEKQDVKAPILKLGNTQDAPIPLINVSDNPTARARCKERTRSGDQSLKLKRSSTTNQRRVPPRMSAHSKPKRVSAPSETATRSFQSPPRPQVRLKTSNHPRRHTSDVVTDSRDTVKAVRTSQHASYARSRSQDRVVSGASANSEGTENIQIKKHFSSYLESLTLDTEAIHDGEYSGLLQDDSNYSDLLDGLSSVAAEDEINRDVDLIGYVPTTPGRTPNFSVEGAISALTDIGDTQTLEAGDRQHALTPVFKLGNKQDAQTPIIRVGDGNDCCADEARVLDVSFVDASILELVDDRGLRNGCEDAADGLKVPTALRARGDSNAQKDRLEVGYALCRNRSSLFWQRRYIVLTPLELGWYPSVVKDEGKRCALPFKHCDLVTRFNRDVTLWMHNGSRLKCRLDSGSRALNFHQHVQQLVMNADRKDDEVRGVPDCRGDPKESALCDFRSLGRLQWEGQCRIDLGAQKIEVSRLHSLSRITIALHHLDVVVQHGNIIKLVLHDERTPSLRFANERQAFLWKRRILRNVVVLERPKDEPREMWLAQMRSPSSIDWLWQQRLRVVVVTDKELSWCSTAMNDDEDDDHGTARHSIELETCNLVTQLSRNLSLWTHDGSRFQLRLESSSAAKRMYERLRRLVTHRGDNGGGFSDGSEEPVLCASSKWSNDWVSTPQRSVSFTHDGSLELRDRRKQGNKLPVERKSLRHLDLVRDAGCVSTFYFSDGRRLALHFASPRQAALWTKKVCRVLVEYHKQEASGQKQKRRDQEDELAELEVWQRGGNNNLLGWWQPRLLVDNEIGLHLSGRRHSSLSAGGVCAVSDVVAFEYITLVRQRRRTVSLFLHDGKVVLLRFTSEAVASRWRARMYSKVVLAQWSERKGPHYEEQFTDTAAAAAAAAETLPPPQLATAVGEARETHDANDDDMASEDKGGQKQAGQRQVESGGHLPNNRDVLTLKKSNGSVSFEGLLLDEDAEVALLRSQLSPGGSFDNLYAPLTRHGDDGGGGGGSGLKPQPSPTMLLFSAGGKAASTRSPQRDTIRSMASTLPQESSLNEKAPGVRAKAVVVEKKGRKGAPRTSKLGSRSLSAGSRSLSGSDYMQEQRRDLHRTTTVVGVLATPAIGNDNDDGAFGARQRQVLPAAASASHKLQRSLSKSPAGWQQWLKRRASAGDGSTAVDDIMSAAAASSTSTSSSSSSSSSSSNGLPPVKAKPQHMRDVKKKAVQGDAFAQFTLGMLHEEGQGGARKSAADALKWYRQAADQGLDEAQFSVGMLFKRRLVEKGGGKGLGDRSSAEEKEEQGDTEAAAWFLLSAAQGHAGAQFSLGCLHEAGKGGFPQSYCQAALWYEKSGSAERGSGSFPPALFNHAHLLENGLLFGTSGTGAADQDKAFELYKRAAIQGLPCAQYNLAVMYSQRRGGSRSKKKKVVVVVVVGGRGGDQLGVEGAGKQQGVNEEEEGGTSVDTAGEEEDSEAEALKWFTRAAEVGGDAVAQFKLGCMLDTGQGVRSRNEAEAAKFMRQAAEQGHLEAISYLGNMHIDGRGLTKSHVDAKRWFLAAASPPADHAPSQYGLGLVFREGGKGVPRNYRLALRWFLKAAHQGHAGAQCGVGSIHEHGLGSRQNASEARKWFALAAGRGNSDAKKALERLGVGDASGSGGCEVASVGTSRETRKTRSVRRSVSLDEDEAFLNEEMSFG